jgi:CRP-like cAMP-binding protein
MSKGEIRQTEVRNRILAGLPADEFEALAPHLTLVEVESGQILYTPEEPIRHIYFIEGGLLSLLSMLEDGTAIEVMMFAYEGVAGVSVLLGAEASAHAALVQVGGRALRMRAGHARAAFDRSEPLRRAVLEYARLMLAHVSQTAVCNALHSVEQRLARWLTLGRQRLGSDELSLTQEFLSQMLGVRRSGVTVAIGALEQAGLIEHRRGLIRVVEAEGLLAASCQCTRSMLDDTRRALGV